MAWPRSGSPGPQALELRAETPRTPKGAGERDTWAPLTWSPFLLTEHAPQALPWSGDWTELARTGSDPWSRVPQDLGHVPADLGPAPFAGLEGAAGQTCTTSAGGAGSWWRAQAADSASWDCPTGPDGAAYWGQGPGGEPRADYTTAWGGPAGSDHPASWDLGLHADCTTASKGYRSPDLTAPSEPSQQSDRATSARYPKTNHRGERSAWRSRGREAAV